MSPFSQLVDADDPLTAELLLGTVELVFEAGGWVHPHARIVARDGQLSVDCLEGSPGPLFRIPQAAWLRVDQVTWSSSPDRLIVEDYPEHFDGLEVEMLYLQVALHNQCSKLPWINATHPSVVDELTDEAVAAVRAIVPEFRQHPVTARDVLFSNRCFRMPLDNGAGAERVLVPPVDLLNHHFAGAIGSVIDGSFVVEVEQAFGTAECALDYGMDRDALEMAVVYGFADTTATIAHSAPVHIRAGGDVVERLTFTMDDPASLVERLRQATGLGEVECRRMIETIADRTIQLLDQVLAVSASQPGNPAMSTLTAAAVHNRGIVRSCT